MHDEHQQGGGGSKAGAWRPSRGVLDLGGLTGLSEAEATARRSRDGPNEIPAQRGHTVLRTVFEVVREPMFVMLVAAGVLYLAMGEPTDALLLLFFVTVVMGITIVQERRTERALSALRDLSSPRALVIREGRQRRIPGREVVRGDLVVLAEGDRVPADGMVRRGIGLSADESLLTGESVPVRKSPDPGATMVDRPGGEGGGSVYSGSLIVAGQGIVEVLATGGGTELGRIGKSLGEIPAEATPLQRETSRLVRAFAAVGLTACAIVVLAYALTRGGGPAQWKEGLLAGIALAMATLPEEFPVVLTVFLALGAWRISRNNVLTRRMPAVETLGAATVLCVDKTGTLTLNRMALRALRAGGRSVDFTCPPDTLGPEMAAVLEAAVLASKRDPFDPMERALHEAGDRWLPAAGRSHPDWTLAQEYPLSPEILAVSHAWERGTTGDHVIACKGAPEAVADLCHLPAGRRAEISAEAEALAVQGLRVLGVAHGRCPAGRLPVAHHDLTLSFGGLLGLEDPLRPGVAEAVAECRAAGVRVVMITGDHPATARSIARQAGLEGADAVMTGAELMAVPEAEVAGRVEETRVFARVVPEQKHRIVRALRDRGEVVAMTGDGVNDAPALKAAHIGIAMGARGTDVAREAASMVLLDDDFSSIVAAVRLGRRIFDNIRKAVAFIVAVHVPIAGLSILPVLFPDWPLLLLPVHIVFLELIIDPSCTLVFESERPEEDVMRRPPRSPGERLLTRASVGFPILQGLSVLAVCVAVFLLSRERHETDSARALAFSTLVVASLAVILVNRSFSRSLLATMRMRNGALLFVAGGAVALLAVVLCIPAGQRMFHFAPLHAVDLLLACAAGVTCVLWFEAVKALRRR